MMGMSWPTSTSVGGGGRAPITAACAMLAGPPRSAHRVHRANWRAEVRSAAREYRAHHTALGARYGERGRDRAGAAHGHLPRRRVGGRCPNGGHGGTRFSEVPASPLARLRRRVMLGARFSLARHGAWPLGPAAPWRAFRPARSTWRRTRYRGPQSDPGPQSSRTRHDCRLSMHFHAARAVRLASATASGRDTTTPGAKGRSPDKALLPSLFAKSAFMAPMSRIRHLTSNACR